MRRRPRQRWLVVAILAAIALLVILARSRGGRGEEGTPSAFQRLDPSTAALQRLESVPAVGPAATPPPAAAVPAPVSNEVDSASEQRRSKSPAVWGVVTCLSRPIRRPPPIGLGDSDALYVEFQSDSGLEVRAAVDADGRYALEHVDPGWWRVDVDARGYQPWEEHIHLSPGERDRRVDIALESLKLRVRVVIDSGDPTLDARRMVRALSDSELEGWFPIVRPLVTRNLPPDRLSDALGDFADSAVQCIEHRQGPSEPGTYAFVGTFDLQGSVPVYAAVAVGNRVVESKLVEPAADETIFRLTLRQLEAARGGMHFRVVDEHGNAPPEPGICTLARSPRATTTALPPFLAKNGEGRLEGLMPGRLGLEIRFPGYAALQIETVVEPGVDGDLGEFRLEPDVTIRGRVLDQNGQPAFARVECLRLSADRRRESIFYSIDGTQETHSDGSFEFPRLGRDTYILRARADGSQSPEGGPILVNTRTVLPDGVELRLRRSTAVFVRLVEAPRLIERILIEDEDHLPVAEADPCSLPDAQPPRGAQQALVELPVGHYTALASSDGQILATRQFDVGNATVDVTIRFD